ncbi:MAG: DUF2178 domain-containing protein [Dehalococcoidia bacterium]|nr:DUF2178 domain-containing protein [Dehalococcoidia bacterium]MDD5495234.1 DUF2178 domain-containing protein [Dehalococcoidia bacterium]
MQISRFRIYKALIAGGLGIAVAIAIVTNTPIIALAAVIAAIVLAFILERTNKEIVRDERIVQISWKAASAAFNTTLILAAVAALGTALFRSQLPENVAFAGTIMGYFICVALLLHMCFYFYFSRKL